MPENFERNSRPQLPDNESEKNVADSIPANKVDGDIVPEIDAESSEKQPSPKQRLFVASCNERLDELVELGMLPSHFAEERKKAANLIEEGFSDDPEEQGREFADIGTESIQQFKVQVDNLEKSVDRHIQPYLEMAVSLASELEQR